MPVVPEVNSTHSVGCRHSVSRLPIEARTRMRREAWPAGHPQRDVESRHVVVIGEAFIAQQRVDAGHGHDRGQLLARHIERQQDEPARDAVELDQGKRGGELIARRDQNRSALQLGEIDVEAGAVLEVAERDLRAAPEQMAPAVVRGVVEPVPQRPHVTVRHFRKPAPNRRA